MSTVDPESSDQNDSKEGLLTLGRCSIQWISVRISEDVAFQFELESQ